ncbi:MAG: arsenosugar biosynthesis radical SAM protein ArsS [bacterium]|nr:arsenosugar biosynthesis radical SAM protein ArsS [bacterium]
MNLVNPTFFQRAEQVSPQFLTAERPRILQINLGLKCNLACVHCHVQAGPKRTEEMSWATMQQLAEWAQDRGIRQVDLTGGSPELHPHIRDFVDALSPKPVQLRTNLTALLLPEAAGLAQFFAQRKVGLVASLPCYSQRNVDQQRGKGTFEASIDAMRMLNALGYGLNPELPLTLVYNPGKATLPPAQAALEADYHQKLDQDFGVHFTGLSCITNMPIGHFRRRLAAEGKEVEYLGLLADSFNEATLPAIMCRHQIHVSWDGTLHDCDFNYALGLPILKERNQLGQISLDELASRPIRTGDHCYGCTAGAGSSCGGALAG